RCLDRLAGAHLLTELTACRYTCHDLLRHYAAERAHGDDSDTERGAAVDRLYRFYLHTVDTAVDTIGAGLVRLPRPPGGHDLPALRFGGPDEALAWLDAERPNLVAAVTAAGPHPAGRLLADALRSYLLRRALTIDWVAAAAAR